MWGNRAGRRGRGGGGRRPQPPMSDNEDVYTTSEDDAPKPSTAKPPAKEQPKKVQYTKKNPPKKSRQDPIRLSIKQMSNTGIDQLVVDIAMLLKNSAPNDKERFIRAYSKIDNFLAGCKLEYLRVDMATFMTNCHVKLTSDVPDAASEQFRANLLRFRNFYDCQAVEKRSLISKGRVTTDVFHNCLTLASHAKLTGLSGELDLLLHVKQPETATHEYARNDIISECLTSKERFLNAFNWIVDYDLVKVKEKYFETICLQAHIFNVSCVFEKLITRREDKLAHIKLLDEVVTKSRKNIPLNRPQSALVNEFGRDKVVSMVGRFCKKYELDPEEHEFFFYVLQIVNDVKYRYMKKSGDDTNHLIMKTIGSKDMKYKIAFLHSIAQLRNCNYVDVIGWATFFKVGHQHLPRRVMDNYEQNRKAAAAFAQKLDQMNVEYVPEDRDFGASICDTAYQVHLITTPSGLDKLIDEFTEKKPMALGMDCEAGSLASGWNSKATLLQLATDTDAYLIDIMVLLDAVPRAKWQDFFDTIFDPEILKFGFSFDSDFAFLSVAFPWLDSYFMDDDRKVLCLFMLMRLAMTNPAMDKAIFKDQNIAVPAQLSLAMVTETFLSIQPDKTMQSSNWTCRPMSEEQLIYAANDAIYTFRVGAKIMSFLSTLSKSVVEPCMAQCYVVYVKKEKTLDKPDSPTKPPKLHVDFRNLVPIIEEINEKLINSGEPYRKANEVTVILDAPMYFMTPYLNNLGIKCIDIRVERTAKKDPRAESKILKDELEKNPEWVLFTTTKRADTFKSHPSQNLSCLPIAQDTFTLSHISGIMEGLKLYIDPAGFFKRCEKCASVVIKKLPAPIYKLVYYTAMATSKGMEPMWTEIDQALDEVKGMDPSDYNGLTLNVQIRQSQRTIPDLFLQIDDFVIKPFYRALYLDTDDFVNFKSFIFKLNENTLKASAHGICHNVCLECGNIYHRDDVEANGLVSVRMEQQPPNSDLNAIRAKICELVQKAFPTAKISC